MCSFSCTHGCLQCLLTCSRAAHERSHEECRATARETCMLLRPRGGVACTRAVMKYLSGSRGPTSNAVHGGQGAFRFAYDPSRLKLPANVAIKDAHGVVRVPSTGNLLVLFMPTPQDRRRQSLTSQQCLIRYQPDGRGGQLFGNHSLCVGKPHGLHLTVEAGTEYLYLVDLIGVVHKASVHGQLVWSIRGPPRSHMTNELYKPTWAASPPNSSWVYIADGYGSFHVHSYAAGSGADSGYRFGGRGTVAGRFRTNHGLSWDERTGLLVVTDRENARHQFFAVDAHGRPNVTFISQISHPSIQLPCILRVAPDSKHAVVPALEGR